MEKNVTRENTRKRAEMQCSDINTGAVQKAEPNRRARNVKHPS